MVSTTNSRRQRSGVPAAFLSTMRVLFMTFLFVACGMAVGLFLGIVGTILYGTMRGGQIDMTNAYRHVAIPLAAVCGSIALIGLTRHEVRTRRRVR